MVSESRERVVEEIVEKISVRIAALERDLGDPLIYITSSEEFARILGSYTIVVSVFSTSWCNPCQAYIPVFRRVARRTMQKSSSIVFVYIDTDKLPDIADKYHVDNLPTTIIFLHGHVADVIVGVTTLSRLEERVESILKEVKRE